MEWGEEEMEEDGGRFLRRNLTKRWRRPEMKKRAARMTMVKRTAGLILLLGEDAAAAAAVAVGDGWNGMESRLKAPRRGEW